MGKKIVKGGWVYDYDISAEYRRKYDCELTDVRYVLGEQFDTDKRNVLICFGLDLDFKFFFALTGSNDNFFCNYMRSRKRNGNMLRRCRQFFPGTPNRLGGRFQIDNIAVRNSIPRKHLNRISFDAIPVFTIARQFNHLD